MGTAYVFLAKLEFALARILFDEEHKVQDEYSLGDIIIFFVAAFFALILGPWLVLKRKISFSFKREKGDWAPTLNVDNKDK